MHTVEVNAVPESNAIVCPITEDGTEQLVCPTTDERGRYYCIGNDVLCDGVRNCPAGEDEDKQACMFHKALTTHLNVLANAILQLSRGN
ncbi:PREDICTED: uncharacterized protein LOC108772404 [Cyphomyrmex costatus]|uniref:uncharacterized protein LOC108772404 n=1 Tax=Cyphomyrmex costatus TaxID=456900 RepID=UPI0008523D47|nr:PREDICTED: uncharacterized protein LOC108772404 [Cyphomyrmex costatus]